MMRLNGALAGACVAALLLGGCSSIDTMRGAAADLVRGAPAADETPGAVHIDRARIDSALNGFVERGQIAGVSALVFQNGREVYYGDFGMADREADRPMRRDTIVQIYSMTKPITGVALMQLYEQGKFQLDDPLAQYAPEFANVTVYAGQDDAGQPIYETPRRPITMRDVTRHTAGFIGPGFENTPAGARMRELEPMSWENTLAQMALELGQVPLVYHPGERWLYSPAVDVQAFLVERLSGQAFDDYVDQHIFGPLGMSETRYVVPPEVRDRMARVYGPNAETGVLELRDTHAFNLRDWPMKPGGFGFTSTLDDYMQFAQMLQNEGELDGARILRPETVRLMATSHLSETITERSWLPNKGNVGFGVDFAVRLAPPTSEERSGAVGEFFWDGAASTLFWVDPANELTAVLFVQLMPFDRIGLHKAFRDAIYAGSNAAAPSAEATQ